MCEFIRDGLCQAHTDSIIKFIIIIKCSSYNRENRLIDEMCI